MARYVALLRGINVGGNNLIRMAALKTCFEKNGFEKVATYIASGNVLFDASEPAGELTRRIEAILSKTFRYEASIVLRSHAQMRQIVEGAPRGFGSAPAKFRYDVLFLKPPLSSATAIKGIPAKEGVDFVHAGPGALYFSRFVPKITQSRINKIVGTPLYKSLTIRNWNTTTKLLALLDAR